MKVGTPESEYTIEVSYMEFVAILLLLIWLVWVALSDPTTADVVAMSTYEVFGING